MDIYNLTYSYAAHLLSDIALYFSSNLEQSSLLFALLVTLASMLIISRKVINLEKTQFKDIDDITSFNRLIDDELGMLKKEHNDLNNVIKNSKFKSNLDDGSESDSKLFNNAPYSQAVQLARRGYAREDIISLCSLTESEAELILALHSDTRAA